MTIKEFHDLAEHMGAKIAFTTSSTAVFQDSGITLTVEVDLRRLRYMTDVEAASLLADAAHLSDKLFKVHGN